MRQRSTHRSRHSMTFLQVTRTGTTRTTTRANERLDALTNNCHGKRIHFIDLLCRRRRVCKRCQFSRACAAMRSGGTNSSQPRSCRLRTARHFTYESMTTSLCITALGFAWHGRRVQNQRIPKSQRISWGASLDAACRSTGYGCCL